jgi:hypothetical protein
MAPFSAWKMMPVGRLVPSAQMVGIIDTHSLFLSWIAALQPPFTYASLSNTRLDLFSTLIAKPFLSIL